MDFFTLSKDAELWIYGNGEIGQKCVEKLEFKGYCVKGYIDRAAEKMKDFNRKPIISPQQISHVLSTETIVIICLQNGMQHDRVAKILSQCGIRKIIYLPMEKKQSTYVRSLYREVYKKVLRGDFTQISQVPLYCAKEINENKIIKEEGEWISFWCQSQQLYFALDYGRDIKKWDVSEELLVAFLDKPLEDCYPYVVLYKYLQGEEKDISSYMSFQGRTTEEEQSKLLEDRKKLYLVYEEAFKYEQSFFTDAPSLCHWNEGGYFNVVDGKHRIHYLLSKGYKEVPIEVPKTDYERYVTYCKAMG